MGNEEYRRAYEAAAKELNGLLEEQEKTEARIMALRRTMNVLSTLCQQEGIDLTSIDRAYGQLMGMIEGSLTNDIRRIIHHTTSPLTASDVREELNKLGGSLAEHKNPLATIHAILNRLSESGEIREVLKEGKKAWRPKLYKTLPPLK